MWPKFLVHHNRFFYNLFGTVSKIILVIGNRQDKILKRILRFPRCISALQLSLFIFHFNEYLDNSLLLHRSTVIYRFLSRRFAQ